MRASVKQDCGVAGVKEICIHTVLWFTLYMQHCGTALTKTYAVYEYFGFRAIYGSVANMCFVVLAVGCCTKRTLMHAIMKVTFHHIDSRART